MVANNNVAMENTLPRPDVREKVTGAARYTADQFPGNVIYARYIRFPFAQGKIASAKLDRARKVPGVLELELDTDTEYQYCGHRMGHVVAESSDAIYDAIAALNIKYDIEKGRNDPKKFYDGPPEPSADEAQQLSEIYDKADVVVESSYETQIQTHSSLETHCCVVDHKGDSADVWASTQAVSGYYGGMRGITGLKDSTLTIHSEFVGGGFGSKFGPGPEGRLAADSSKKYGRPCRAVLDRREEHLDTGNRPGSIQYMKIAATKDGKMLGGRVDCQSVVGWQPGRGGCRNPSLYEFGDIVRTESDIPLSAGLPAAFRAPGFPQGSFALESMMDELSAKLAIDPVEFRILNETSNRRKKQWTRGAELIGWKDRKPDGSQNGTIVTGYGCGGAQWFNVSGDCGVDCTIYRSGDVEVRVGIQDIGTGTSAVAVDTVCDHLGLTRDVVTGKVGNSDYPNGPASGGSTVTRVAVPALKDAAQNAMKALGEIAAKEWGVTMRDIAYKDGQFRSRGGESMSWREAAGLMSDEKLSVTGKHNRDFWGDGTSDGVQFAKVEVDRETGIVRAKKIVVVQACGKPVNRLTLENQYYGGVIQGVSYALLEDRRLDPQVGGMVNADFLGYKIAGSLDLPEIVADFDWNEDDTGARSVGEPVTIPTSGAIANAVANALGVRVRSLPITPQRVLEAIEKGGKS